MNGRLNLENMINNYHKGILKTNLIHLVFPYLSSNLPHTVNELLEDGRPVSISVILVSVAVAL